MKMADFKVLSRDEQLTKLNNHLLSLQSMEGRLEDNFKRDEFDFSYSLLKKNAAELGIIVDGKNYVAYAAGNEPPAQQDIVKAKQIAVKTKQDVVKSQQDLTSEELAFVKQLFKDHQAHNNEQQFIVNGKPMLVLPTMVGAKKTTGISVYIEQWERWADFKAKHNMYSGTDLLAMALQEFMDKYDDNE